MAPPPPHRFSGSRWRWPIYLQNVRLWDICGALPVFTFVPFEIWPDGQHTVSIYIGLYWTYFMVLISTSYLILRDNKWLNIKCQTPNLKFCCPLTEVLLSLPRVPGAAAVWGGSGCGVSCTVGLATVLYLFNCVGTTFITSFVSFCMFLFIFNNEKHMEYQNDLSLVAVSFLM